MLYRTIDLRRLFEVAERYYEVDDWLDQPPRRSNYLIYNLRQVVYCDELFRPSTTNLRQHLHLSGLTPSCQVELTKSQAECVETLICVLRKDAG